MKLSRLPAPALILATLLLPANARTAQPSADARGVEFFEKKVRPVLVEHCGACHSARAKKLKGKLLMDSRADLLKGGESGPVLVPGKPAESRLIEAVHYRNVDLQMPPKGKLPASVIEDLEAWVKMGAPWPGTAGATVVKEAFDLQARKKRHWSWRPLAGALPPPVNDRQWTRTEVDRFLLAKLEEKGLRPARDADRRTLLRRLSFDLTGLPPSPEAILGFEADTSLGAYERVVDRLLASPHFGESWGRHWLDLVRYGETRGHEFDPIIPNAYQYRDYLIRALNDDVPYNQLVEEHLAGDLLERPRVHPGKGFNESILGTGFWFLGEEVHSPVDIRADQADRFDNRIDVMTKTFLGLTVSCARCHDHKFDAISSRDYYALYGYLSSSNYRQVRFDTLEHNKKIAHALWQARRKRSPEVEKALGTALSSGADTTRAYLLAAREAIQGSLDRKSDFATQPGIVTVARKHKLDAKLLAGWVSAVLTAREDAKDPLHAWARLSNEPVERQPQILASLRLTRRPKPSATRVIFDYRAAMPADWMPDDVTFGPGPAQAGSLIVRGTPDKPVVRIVERTAGEFDAFWSDIRLSHEAQNEPGRLGQQVRSGRTLRTPSFKLTSGKLQYLVRGSGMAYAAAGSHVMIEGPLHGRLVQMIPAAPGSSYRWISHDLTPYSGQNIHVEFSAGPPGDLAVAMVIEGPPPEETQAASLSRLLGSNNSDAELASGYARLFHQVAEQLRQGRLTSAVDPEGQAWLAGWMVRHSDLFTQDTPWQQPAAVLLREEAGLAPGIRRESRLAPAMQDGSGVDEYVFIRGSHRSVGETVPRRFLEALTGSDQPRTSRGSGRLALARHMLDTNKNPLVARVLVNRVWHHLFGQGIVASVDDFGVMGQPPTHPELLDYLALQFIEDGWSIKRLIRSLVLTRAYQMASQVDAQTDKEIADKRDPGNLLLHRARVRRLSGEAIRDALLAISGGRDQRMYGPSINVHLTDFQQGRGRPASGPIDGDGRRSIYLAVKRNFVSSLLLAFDTPTPFSTVGRRTVSNVPAQSLILMNDPFVHQQTRLWGERMQRETGTVEERIREMYLAAFGRPPHLAEMSACKEYLDDNGSWDGLAHALVNVKEFIYLP